MAPWISVWGYYPRYFRPPLWSSGQSSCLQIQRSWLDSRRCQIFWEVLSLEWGPFALVNTIEELLERKISGSSLENGEYGRSDSLRWPRDTLCPQRLALTSTTSGGRSVGIIPSRTQATEFFFYFKSNYIREPLCRVIVSLRFRAGVFEMCGCCNWNIVRTI
jgi:hypothetical protein